MYETIGTVLVVLIVGLAVLWLFLMTYVFRRLEKKHPDTYSAIGSPTLFSNKAIRDNGQFFRFLFGGNWKHLDDRALSRSCNFMRYFLAFYIVIFGGLFFLMVSGRMSPTH